MKLQPVTKRTRWARWLTLGLGTLSLLTLALGPAFGPPPATLGQTAPTPDLIATALAAGAPGRAASDGGFYLLLLGIGGLVLVLVLLAGFALRRGKRR